LRPKNRITKVGIDESIPLQELPVRSQFPTIVHFWESTTGVTVVTQAEKVEGTPSMQVVGLRELSEVSKSQGRFHPSKDEFELKLELLTVRLRS